MRVKGELINITFLYLNQVDICTKIANIFLQINLIFDSLIQIEIANNSEFKLKN